MKIIYNLLLIILMWVTNLTIYFMGLAFAKIVVKYGMEKNQYTSYAEYGIYLGMGILSYYPMKFIINEFKKLERK